MNSVEEWHGIYAACFTPLADDEHLDEDAFERAARALIGEGQRGLYVCGSTGEGYALGDDVRCAAFRVAARIGRELGARIIAHVGSVPSKRAAAMARAAAECGCDSVAAIPPAGGRYSYAELTDYYTRLGQSTRLPLLVYHIPELSGYDFARDELSRWMDLPNVAGIKFSSYDMYKFERLIALHSDKMFFHGADQMLMHGIALGAPGAIGSTYNLAGPIATEIFAAIQQNDIATARKMQAALNAFIEVMHANGGQRAMKALAARRFEWQNGLSAQPALAATAEQLERVERALSAALETVPAGARR
jgi:N-acetylneuraminate lyase